MRILLIKTITLSLETQRRYLDPKLPGSSALYYVLHRKFVMHKGRLLSPNLNWNDTIIFDRCLELLELQ
jgi:hypothetical protein